MKIHIVIPYFHARTWLETTLSSLRGFDGVTTLVNMDEPIPGTRYPGIGIVNYPQPNAKGGEPLPGALMAGVKRHPEADITILIDPDAPLIRHGWRQDIERLFADPDMVCAAINPRCDLPEFAGVAEWNWCALRTDFFLKECWHFDWQRHGVHDIGHIFSRAAKRCGKRVKLWPGKWKPFPDKAAMVCGDEDGDWAVHAFYSSRKLKEALTGERQWVLTDNQETALQQMVIA